MRSPLLRSICVFLMLRTLVAMGFPVVTDTDEKASLERNSIAVNGADASVKFYTCVHIPPELENCNFLSYRVTTENSGLSENGRMGRRKRKLLNHNKENMLHSSANTILGTEESRFPRQKVGKIIIYEIQRCVPPRLPFVLPWCMPEDLADKESVIYRLTPMVRKSTYIKPLVLPDYNI